MPAFILLCHDKADSLPLRQETRERHLDYIAGKGSAVLLAGPILDDNGQPAGSMLLIDAEDAEAARSFAQADPYAEAGLFENVDIKPYRIVTGALAPDADS